MPPRSRRAGSWFRTIVWGALGMWAVALVVLFVGRSPRTARAGELLVEPPLEVQRVGGGTVRLIAADSPTVIVAATSECAACRQGIPTYRALSGQLGAHGVAFRVLVGSDSLAARQFTRLLSDPSQVGWDPGQKLFRRLGVRSVPTVYLVAQDGRLLKTWAPFSINERAAADTIAVAVKQLR